MKKIITKLISVAMIITSIPFASVYGLDEKELNLKNISIEEVAEDSKTQDKILNDIANLSNLGISEEYLNGIVIEDVGIVYEYKISDEAKSTVAVKNLANGDVEYDITEGNLNDTLVISENGDVYLDGFKVEMSSDGVNQIIQPRDRTIWTTDEVPFGRASDYTLYHREVKTWEIKLGKMVGLVTVAGMGIILGAMVPFAGPTITVATIVLEILEALDPTITTPSCKTTQYYHKNGYQVDPYLRVIKNDSRWYAKPNYQGASMRTITYNCVEMY